MSHEIVNEELDISHNKEIRMIVRQEIISVARKEIKKLLGLSEYGDFREKTELNRGILDAVKSALVTKLKEPWFNPTDFIDESRFKRRYKEHVSSWINKTAEKAAEDYVKSLEEKE